MHRDIEGERESTLKKIVLNWGFENKYKCTNQHLLVFMSDYAVTELTWENGQLAMHGLGGLLPTLPEKPTWGTLESVVHQAIRHKRGSITDEYGHQRNNVRPHVASSSGQWSENTTNTKTGLTQIWKRSRSEFGPSTRHCSSDTVKVLPDPSVCASASATFCRENDTKIMTREAQESPGDLSTKTDNGDLESRGRQVNGKSTKENQDKEHVSRENQDKEHASREDTVRSLSTRRSRVAAVHNQSERRRRDRINEKMKALQKLVPNSSKTDKASMLDEVIEYLKQLKAQIQMMSVASNMAPQMMMPVGMQQHLQMSLLARMGMGMGMGMGLGMGTGMMDMGMMDMSIGAQAATASSIPPILHPNLAATATPSFIQPPFLVPPTMAATPTSHHPTMPASFPINDAYYAYQAQQSMNVDFYNKMAMFYQQLSGSVQAVQATTNLSQPNHACQDENF